MASSSSSAAAADPEALRTSALSSLRALLLEASGGGDRMSRERTAEAFRSAEFASRLFRLFDGEAEGFLMAEDVINLAKFNFRG